MTGDPVVSTDGRYVIAPSEKAIYKATPIPGPGDTAWWHWVHTDPFESFSDIALKRDDHILAVATGDTVDLMSYALSITFQYFPTGMSPRVPMVSNADYVYVPTGTYPFYQIRVYPGTGYFDMGLGNWTVGPPAATPDGKIYATSDGGAVFGFDSPSGAVHVPFAKYSLPGARFASPPVIDADGRIYALTRGGKVICLTRKLFPVWSYDLGATAVDCELAIGNDGTLYAGGTNKLVAFK